MLHEARAREECTYWYWRQEVIHNQRAAEACGGTIILGGRVREECAERAYMTESATRQKYTELCKTTAAYRIEKRRCDTQAARCDDLSDDGNDLECTICGDVGGQS
jgi:hypothetical protein